MSTFNKQRRRFIKTGAAGAASLAGWHLLTDSNTILEASVSDTILYPTASTLDWRYPGFIKSGTLLLNSSQQLEIQARFTYQGVVSDLAPNEHVGAIYCQGRDSIRPELRNSKAEQGFFTAAGGIYTFNVGLGLELWDYPGRAYVWSQGIAAQGGKRIIGASSSNANLPIRVIRPGIDPAPGSRDSYITTYSQTNFFEPGESFWVRTTLRSRPDVGANWVELYADVYRGTSVVQHGRVFFPYSDYFQSSQSLEGCVFRTDGDSTKPNDRFLFYAFDRI